MSEQDTLILLASGKDRSGLANVVSKYVHDHDCTIVDARMDTVGSCFAALVQLAGKSSAIARVRDGADEWGKRHDLSITVHEDDADRRAAVDMLRCDLRVDALERAGIIDDVTRVLSDHGVNVYSLEGQKTGMPFSGEERFVMEAVLELPASSSPDVHTALEALDLDFVLTPLSTGASTPVR